jgi:hypothetical protein
VSGGASVTSFSPSIGIGTTGYYAQARNTTTGCVSASRLRVNGVANPIPGVPTMGGAATQCNSATVTATRGTNGTGIRWTDGDGSSTVSPRTVTTPGTYYAVTTSAAGCTSGTASVSVTITTQKGAEGEPVTACGCIQENKLGDCYGTCQVSCPFTMCGFSVTAFNVIMSKWGSSWCNDLPGGGWRIPTKQELLCLCTNSSNVPAGIISYWAWSSDVAENGNHIAVELFSGNETSIGDSYNFTYLCVK